MSASNRGGNSSSSLVSLTVKCDLAQDGIVGRVHMRIGIDRTLDSLLDEFCSHKRARRLATFALRNDLHSELPLDLTVASAGLSTGDTIYVFNTDPPLPPPEPVLSRESASNWRILAGAAFAIALFGSVAVVVIFVLTNQPVEAYGIVIDAGSSSSKVYVYTWPASKTNGNGVVSQRAFAKNSTAPIESPHGVNQIVTSLRSVTWAVPEDRQAKSLLFLGATAGMRLYQRLNASSAEAVLSRARDALTSGFNYKVANASGQIRIITGAEEAVGSWITVNYLKDSFGDFSSSSYSSSVAGRLATSIGGLRRKLAPGQDTYGSLDLGGASTQIAFSPAGNYSGPQALLADDSNKQQRHIVQFSLYGQAYSVYAYSFLCYGKAEAEHRLLATVIAGADYNASIVVDCPCWQSGYTETVPGSQVFQRPCSDDWALPGGKPPPADVARRNFSVRGSGNYQLCGQLVRPFFNATCDQTSCSFNDVFQPAPSGRFVAFSGFYYVAAFFNATAADWAAFSRSVESFCSKPYSATAGAASSVVGASAENFLRWYCFDGVYVLSLLGAYGFNASNWASLEFADSIAVNHTKTASDGSTQAVIGSTSNKVGWSLGYMIQQSGLIPAESPLVSLSLTLFVILLVMFAAFLAFGILFACIARRSRRGGSAGGVGGRQPQGYAAI